MNRISLNLESVDKYITDEDYNDMKKKIYEAHDFLENKNGKGREMLGFLNYANNVSNELIDDLVATAKDISDTSDVLVVIGIGGSYLGSKAVIDMLTNNFFNIQARMDRKAPQIIFAGNTLSGKYLRELVEYLSDKNFSVNVISKSGKTLEPAITFRTLRVLLEEKYGENKAKKRIFVTTDGEDGLLKQIADINEYKTFEIPKDIGGRYSVLTPVGLLPIAVAGIDLRDLLDGAIFAEYVYKFKNIEENSCYKYAAIRNILYEKYNKDIEIMCSYEPNLNMFLEWYKQLFGESQGKEGKGVFPASVTLTTDLHSMGQLIQEGKRNIFETVINIQRKNSLINLPSTEKDEDKLNYLAGMEIDEINDKAFQGTLKAHSDGNVPVTVINVEELNAYNVGILIYFFEKACAVSSYALGVNPFNQPGVEAYKGNMMNLLNRRD